MDPDAARADTRAVPIDTLLLKPEFRLRAHLETWKVEEYAALFDRLPPVLAARVGGELCLLDGFHRLAAARALGRSSIQARVLYVSADTAYELAVQANAGHGLPLKSKEKKAAGRGLLTRFPERSDRWIAEVVGLDHKTVTGLRADLEAGGQIGHLSYAVGRDGRRYPCECPRCQAVPEDISSEMSGAVPAAQGAGAPGRAGWEAVGEFPQLSEGLAGDGRPDLLDSGRGGSDPEISETRGAQAVPGRAGWEAVGEFPQLSEGAKVAPFPAESARCGEFHHISASVAQDDGRAPEVPEVSEAAGPVTGAPARPSVTRLLGAGVLAAPLPAEPPRRGEFHHVSDRVAQDGEPDLTQARSAADAGAGRAPGAGDLDIAAPESDIGPAAAPGGASAAAGAAADPDPDVTPARPAATPRPGGRRLPDLAGPVSIWHGDARDLAGWPIDPVHLVVTSPPYNVGLRYAAHDDNLPVGDYRALLGQVWRACHAVMADGARIAVVLPFGTGRNPWLPLAGPVADLLCAAGFTLRGQIVWDKGTSGGRTTWGSFRLPTDPCLRDTTEAIVVAHKGAGHLPVPAAALAHDSEGSHSLLLADPAQFMALAQDHWTVPPESAARVGHPAPFPVGLAERLIRFYAYQGAHILDPFAGSGTVGVAAQRLGCAATLIDIDPTYCDLAKLRVESGVVNG